MKTKPEVSFVLSLVFIKHTTISSFYNINWTAESAAVLTECDYQDILLFLKIIYIVNRFENTSSGITWDVIHNWLFGWGSILKTKGNLTFQTSGERVQSWGFCRPVTCKIIKPYWFIFQEFICARLVHIQLKVQRRLISHSSQGFHSNFEICKQLKGDSACHKSLMM